MKRQSWSSNTSGILVEQEIIISREDGGESSLTPPRPPSVVSITSNGRRSSLSEASRSRFFHPRSTKMGSGENTVHYNHTPRSSSEDAPSVGKRSNDIDYMVDLLQQPPPPGNYMSASDSASIKSQDGERWNMRKLFRKSRKQEELPALSLPDSAVPSTTSGGHQHIAISIPSPQPNPEFIPELQQSVSLGTEFQREIRRRFSTSDFGDRGLSPVVEENEPPESPSAWSSKLRNPSELVNKAQLGLARASNRSVDPQAVPGPSSEPRQSQSTESRGSASRLPRARRMSFHEQRAAPGKGTHPSNLDLGSSSTAPFMHPAKSSGANTLVGGSSVSTGVLDLPDHAKTQINLLPSPRTDQSEASRLTRASFDETILIKRTNSGTFGKQARPSSVAVQPCTQLDDEAGNGSTSSHPSSSARRKETTEEAPMHHNTDPRDQSKLVDARIALALKFGTASDIDWARYPALSSVAQQLDAKSGAISPQTTSHESKLQMQGPRSPTMRSGLLTGHFLGSRGRPEDHGEASFCPSQQQALPKMEKLRDFHFKQIEERLEKLEQISDTLVRSFVPLMENLNKLLQEQNTLLESTYTQPQEPCPHPRPSAKPPPPTPFKRAWALGPASNFIPLTPTLQSDAPRSPELTAEPQGASLEDLESKPDSQNTDEHGTTELEDRINRAESSVKAVIATTTAAVRSVTQQPEQHQGILTQDVLPSDISKSDKSRPDSAISTRSQRSTSGSEYSVMSGPTAHGIV